MISTAAACSTGRAQFNQVVSGLDSLNNSGSQFGPGISASMRGLAASTLAWAGKATGSLKEALGAEAQGLAAIAAAITGRNGEGIGRGAETAGIAIGQVRRLCAYGG